jgi:CRP/FNR family transcriptional regulator, cyclic AMP receptor protein
MKELDVSKYDKLVNALSIFKYLSDEEKATLRESSEILGYTDKENIITEGDVQPYIFAVIKGSVHVMVAEKEAKPVYICTIGDGDVFGEAGIFLKMKRTANVVSTGDCVILRIKRESFLGFVKKNPSAGLKILILIIYSLLRKLRDANQEIAFERKSDFDQADVDSLINDIMF